MKDASIISSLSKGFWLIYCSKNRGNIPRLAMFFCFFLCQNSEMVQSEFVAAGHFQVKIVDSQQLVGQFVAPGIEGYVLGRSDSGSPYLPDIDLKAHHALEKGVSRRHAVLLNYRNRLHVMDLGSVNGTLLNDERLQPDRPYGLCEGDRLCLGSLNLALIKIK